MNANTNNNPQPLTELLITLVIPSIILMKFSGPKDLGAVNALLLALAFPLFWVRAIYSSSISSTCLPRWA